MTLSFAFFFNSILLGIGLAMDAFSVSMANGLCNPQMKKGKMLECAGIFALFQFAMPLIGWFCVSSLAELFDAFQKWIPWIALVLLCFLGIKMIVESFRPTCVSCEDKKSLGLWALTVQGIATSIDALSVGFTISEYTFFEALLACALIGVVTLAICLGGIFIGKKAGTRLAGKAGLLGGSILMIIGLEIFITGVF